MRKTPCCVISVGAKNTLGAPPPPLQPFFDFKWSRTLSPLNFLTFPEIPLGYLRPRAQKSNMPVVPMVRSYQLFSMGDNSKILFPSIGFPYPVNSKKQFSSSWGGPNGPLGAFWLVLGQKMPILGQICKKIKIF